MWRNECQAIIAALMICFVLGTGAASAQDADRSAINNLHRAEQEGVDIVGAIGDSFKLLMLEHLSRVAFQDKTRRELSGPFFADYRRSVRVPAQWGDTDPWWVNYVGHSIHGAAAAHIWRDRESSGRVNNPWTREYWASVARATAWSATYSTQFEIGPLSEASIGNVGFRPETTGWVDYVITPVGGLGLIVAEDVLDRVAVRSFERRVGNRVARVLVRLALNPGRTLANTARGNVPWHRPDRGLTSRADEAGDE